MLEGWQNSQLQAIIGQQCKACRSKDKCEEHIIQKTININWNNANR